MKKSLILFVLFVLCQSIYAQEFTVIYVGGKITSVKNGKQEKINVNSKLTKSTIVDVPYEGKLDLLDEKNKKRYSISKPGRCSIATHISSSGNTTMELTERYLTYLRGQLGDDAKRAKVVRTQVYSDYATVTRTLKIEEEREEKEELQNEINRLTPKQRLLAKRELNRKRHNAFRDSVIKCHLAFVRKAWQRHDVQEPTPRPKFEKIVPKVVEPDSVSTDRLKVFDWLRGVFSSKKNKDKIVVVPKKEEIESPAPLFEVKEQKPLIPEMAEKDTVYFPFVYCGTEFKVRLDETKRVNIGKVDPFRIADVLERFSNGKYDNLLYDCQQIRKEHNLNDWAYYKMVQTLCDEFFGKDTKEAVLLAGYLCYQSGYSVRFATNREEDRLFLLMHSNHVLYGLPYVIYGEKKFYYMTENSPKETWSCDEAEFPKEKGLSLFIKSPLLLEKNQGEVHTIHGYRGQDSIRIGINQNLMKFYDTYPPSEINDNFLTRWAVYANTPLNPEVEKQLYPQLKKIIAGKSEVEQVNSLMNILHGMPYGYDDEIWGRDRAFFTEETLNYPYCDCEDRSIALTRWVRDLIGLKCALIYYPNHLATLIHFNEDVKNGSYYLYDDIKYTVCDPTYFGAKVGKEMNDLDTDNVKIIPLN